MKEVQNEHLSVARSPSSRRQTADPEDLANMLLDASSMSSNSPLYIRRQTADPADLANILNEFQHDSENNEIELSAFVPTASSIPNTPTESTAFSLNMSKLNDNDSSNSRRQTADTMELHDILKVAQMQNDDADESGLVLGDILAPSNPSSAGNSRRNSVSSMIGGF